MPAYVGSKFIVSKELYKAITEKVGTERHNFYDIFCGGLNASYPFLDIYNVYCSDYNEDLIYLLNYVKNNELPEQCPEISKEQYLIYKNSNEMSFEKCFSLFYCTFKCMYKGIYVPSEYFYEKNRNDKYHSQRFSSLKREKPLIEKIKSIDLKDYRDYDFSNGGNVVYLDPPYVNTGKFYKHFFDTEEFWKIAKKWKDQGNHVFVSEKTCPIEHEVLYSKDIPAMGGSHNKFTDKLFYIL